MTRKKIESTGNIRRDVALKITIIGRQIHKQFDNSVHDLGVTRSQWGVIALVARRPGATQRIIADMLEVSEASAGRLIDRLCKDGFLERRQSEHDARAWEIYTTSKAKPILEKLSVHAEVLEESIFTGFSKSDLNQLNTLLDQLYENIRPK
ncbi:MAG TPA: MarR family transcriptional regulator [Verrucomicrobiae bacterium]|nr:MarR family transcriptional regulator [Verrucomicrobiae bacterium]